MTDTKLTYQLADTVLLKKPRVCQVNNWEVLRLGADIHTKCMGCGHILMMPQADFNKRIKKILIKANDPVNKKLEHYLPKESIALPK